MSPKPQSNNILSGNIVVVLSITTCLAPAANAAETSSNVGYSLEYTDNARLVPNDKEEEWTNVLSAGFSLLEQSKSLDAQIRAQAAYQNYRNNIFNDDTVLTLNSNVLWRISPDRFSWTVEDYLSQTSIQSFAPDTPSNRQQVNVFTTGPDFMQRISPVQALQLGVRYIRNTYDTSDLDNTRNFAQGRWIYQSSPRTVLSLNYDAQNVNYDNDITNTNFDRQDAYLRIENRLASNSFVLDAGGTSIQRENIPDVDGSLARFSWTRLVSPVSTFVLSASSELSDAGQQQLIAGQTAAANQPSVQGVSITGDVFRTENAGVTFTHRRLFGNDIIQLYKTRNEYKSSPTVEEWKGGNLNIGYELTGASVVSFIASYIRSESTATDPTTIYRDKNYGLLFATRLIRNVSLWLELGRNRRDNVDDLQSYTERHAILTLSYDDRSTRSSFLFK